MRRRIGSLTSVALLSLAIPSLATATLTLSLTSEPTFGILFSGASNRQFILNTDDSISGTDSSDYISGAAAGSFSLTDSTSPASINLLVDNIGTSGGLTVNDVVCSYDGGSQQSCDGSGLNVTSTSSATIKLGLDISTSSAHSGGDTASVSLDLSISYL